MIEATLVLCCLLNFFYIKLSVHKFLLLFAEPWYDSLKQKYDVFYGPLGAVFPVVCRSTRSSFSSFSLCFVRNIVSFAKQQLASVMFASVFFPGMIFLLMRMKPWRFWPCSCQNYHKKDYLAKNNIRILTSSKIQNGSEKPFLFCVSHNCCRWSWLVKMFIQMQWNVLHLIINVPILEIRKTHF